MPNDSDQFDSLFRVRLQEFGATKRRVVFRTTPELTENTTVNYKTIDPLHMPGSMQVYTNTAARSYNINSVKLVSRTRKEASANMARLNMLRSWQRPRFGENSNTGSAEDQFACRVDSNRVQSNTKDRAEETTLDDLDTLLYGQSVHAAQLGSPPAVVLLSAYSKESKTGNIYKVPCVITQLSIPYTSDVDYIPTLEGVPFPFLITIDIMLTETHSPREFERFNLEDFRKGKLTGF